jgi:alpha-galactosidase
MTKILMIGAGSFFTKDLVKDILLIPGIEDGIIALVDIDSTRLQLSHKLVDNLIKKTGRKSWSVVSSVDRTEVMMDSDYIISMIEVSGMENVKFDNNIPLKYGVKQCIGDTIGPGGVFKALRTIPSWIAVLKDAERLCPEALVMNYTNPMSMMMLAAVQSTKMQIVGLCHSVQGTSKRLAEYLELPYEEIEWECAGINHMAWFTKLKHKERDMYPVLREKIKDPELYEKDPVRFEFMLQFGAFVTESSGHFSEYVPYFRKREDLITEYCRDGYKGETSFYANNWPKWRKENDKKLEKIISGEEEIILEPSHEYASVIIKAHYHNKPAVIHGSMENKGLIENLPGDGVVEVPVMINGNGFNPCRFGELPPHLAAVNRSNMAVYEMAVKAVIENDKESVFHALALDPLTASVCSLAEIRSMTNELLEVEKDYLPF